MIEIRAVNSKADLKNFINYPYQKYQHDPNFVPPLRMGEWEKFNPAKNPFYEHARMDLFLAFRDGKIVGRIAAIDDDLHNETHHENLMFFGFFEAADQEAALELFKTVEAVAKRLGRGRIRGPVNPSMNDGAGFQIDAFDTDPYIMMPQNPPEYPTYVEAAGYHKIKDLYAWYFETGRGMGERIERLAKRLDKRIQYTIRSLNMKNYQEDVDQVLNFYNDVWEDNWGQIKYTDAEARKLAADLKLIVNPKLVLFLEINQELAGLAVCFPDANQVFKRLPNGRLFPFGIFTLLRKNQIIDRVRLPILGVKPEFRNKGLELVLINEIYKRGVEQKVTGGELSWELEDNVGINKAIEAAGATLYKTYRLYQKDFIQIPERTL